MSRTLKLQNGRVIRKGDYLTPVENQVFKLLCVGYNAIQVGEIIGSKRKTIDHHRRNIYVKAGVVNSIELVWFAIEHGVIDIEKRQKILNYRGKVKNEGHRKQMKSHKA